MLPARLLAPFLVATRSGQAAGGGQLPDSSQPDAFLEQISGGSSSGNDGKLHDLLLDPLPGKSGQDVALIIGQGAQIPAAAYEPLARSIQHAVQYRLWVGVPDGAPEAAVTPRALAALEAGAGRVARALEARGLPRGRGRQTFYCGHSLGGDLVVDLVNATAPSDLLAGPAVGVILLGAFLSRRFRSGGSFDAEAPQYAYPVPVLTVGGTLDGLARVTRIAEASHTHIAMASDPWAAGLRLPVTLVEGMSHMQFASGRAPRHIVERDLLPEVSQHDAHRAVAEDVAAFFACVLEENYGALERRVRESSALVRPLIEALKLEGYHHFLPPCRCRSRDEFGGFKYSTCRRRPGCQGGSPWAERAMAIMGHSDGIRVRSVDSQQPLILEELTAPAYSSNHLPFLHSGRWRGQRSSHRDPRTNPGGGRAPSLCSTPRGCVLDATTVTEPVYDCLDSLDTGFTMLSAAELRCRMKSRQAVQLAAGIASADFAALDSPEADRCREINEDAIAWALESADDKARGRFRQYGQPLVTGSDVGTCKAETCWVYTPLGWHDDGHKVTIASISFAVANNESLPFAGMHFCKLLSPARALEWMYIDGLRRYYSLKSQEIRDEHAVSDRDRRGMPMIVQI